MGRILITGGNGNLGQHLLEVLHNQGQTVRVMSRKPRPDEIHPEIEWVQADVINGEGVESALRDVDTIVNCMSSPRHNTYQTDILGTITLLKQAKQMTVRYVVHISIIGIDRIIFPYYQHKLGAEIAVMESGIPYLIARISQFHSFVDFILSPLREIQSDTVTIPVNVQFQPISTGDVASYLAPTIIKAETSGRIEFGGNEILRLDQLASNWLEAQDIEKTIIPATDSQHDLSFLNAFGDGYVNGYNTSHKNRVPSLSWSDYLKAQYE